MIKFKKLAVALALMLGTTAGAVLIATPAQASLNCGNGRICTYQGTLADYGQYDFNASSNVGCHYVGDPLNDGVRSTKVGGSVPGIITWYTNANCTGYVVTTNASSTGNNYRSCTNVGSLGPWNTSASPCAFYSDTHGFHYPSVSAFYYSG